jgi:acyl-CoA reductase-like NAD-dependent aldehyde dehydrogenase
MTVFDEEAFGPVAAITRVRDADAAVKAANVRQFGLSGNIWTSDVELARRMAREMYTGGVFINGVTAADPRVPVGGVKKSGYGREPLRRREGFATLDQYCQRMTFSKPMTKSGAQPQ